MKKYNIIIQVDKSISDNLKSSLEQLNHIVPAVLNIDDDTSKSIKKYSPDLLIVDIGLKDNISKSKKLQKYVIPYIYLSNNKTNKLKEYNILTKPLNIGQLYNCIEITIHVNKLQKQINNDYILIPPTHNDYLIIAFNYNKKIFSVNNICLEQLGYERSDIINKNIHDYIHDKDKDTFNTYLTNSTSTPYTKHACKIRLIKKDGSALWVQVQIISIHDKSGILYSQINCENISQSRQIEEELNKFKQQIESKVTERTLQLSNINYQLSKEIEERKRIQDQIKNSLEEKEILLREIHHRVKNNLQIISSLLSLQSNNLNNEFISKKFKESQNRIYSMALIHEHLYESDNLNKIIFSEYINKLANTIFDTYDKSHSDIKLGH